MTRFVEAMRKNFCQTNTEETEHNSEIAVKKVQASRVVYCELIGEGELTELI